MDYKLYHSEDFVADESFIAYYHRTDKLAIAFWTDWIAHHPEKLDEICNAEQLLAKLSFRLDEQELQDQFRKFDEFLFQESGRVEESEINRSKLTVKKWVLACALCLLFTFTSYYIYQSQFNKIIYLTYYNGNGKISELLLSDGTKILLNCNSTLKYPKEFKGNKREIELEGEAFLEVSKDKSRPFSVVANGIKTTVLGTKFNVSAYKNTSKIEVALVEGKVEVQTLDGSDKMILRPNELASFNLQSGALTRSNFTSTHISSWKDGTIIFDNASFKDISGKLYNVYGIKLVDHTKKMRWNYSGQFEKTAYLTIIKSICFAKKINYQQSNQTITLTN